jgi:multidrug efflux pump
MNFTDIYVRKPVLAMVVSLVILVLGLRSVDLLPIREFPFTQNAEVTVTTYYTGADPDLIAGFISTPLEKAIAQANGIDYLTSSSNQNSSTITAYLRLNYDPQKALTEISTQVNSVLNQLPKDALLPFITVAVGGTLDAMYIGFYSDVLPSNKITDYLVRVVQPKLQAVPDVQLAEILGGRNFAMRAWLDPLKMAAHGITSSDVRDALAANNFIAAVGRTDGESVTVNLTTETSLVSVEEFNNLVVKQQNQTLVRLKDVARVALGSENYDTAVKFDGREAVYVGIQIAPAANLLTVIKNVREIFPDIQAALPQGLKADIVYDSTKYVNSSIHEVERSLIEAIFIVVIVIFLFLASIRSMLIPIVAIPLSIIGTFFIMFLLGYSINLLTLLALVLSIGLVVDDAIIVVENVYRHMEEGMPPLEASLLGARELANPIIAITVVLIAVYLPIGFLGGLTGALFTEFAFTLAGAVTVSAIIALTLSPMMCSKFLKTVGEGKFAKYVNYQFGRLEETYSKALHGGLDNLSVPLVFAIIILSSLYFLYSNSKSELAPQEDQGFVISLLTASPNSTLEQTQAYGKQVFDIYKSYEELDHVFQIEGRGGLNIGLYGIVLKPWDERSLRTNVLQKQLQQKLSQIAGAKVVAFQRPPLPGGGNGLPLQVVIETTEPYLQLNEVAQTMMDKAMATGMFMFMDSDLKIDKLQTSIDIDRQKAALLGLNMRDLGSLLQSSLSQGYVNFFNYAGRAYQVIPQVERKDRINASQLMNYYMKASDGTPIPLSTVATLKSKVVPESINHFQQLNSATISGVPGPGVSLGQTIQLMKDLAKEHLPLGYTLDYAGQSRQFEQEAGSLVVTFFFSIIIIFLCLSALFNSFRDPLIVLISVPMSICGALIFISLGVGGATLNIYTEVGLVTLIGLISKHGILIVQFANDLRLQGHAKREAVEMAASIRLRPILVTTAAMVLGVLPLLTASGAGAVSRYSIGLVIFTGISIGTFFTLFIVPAMYMLVSRDYNVKKV